MTTIHQLECCLDKAEARITALESGAVGGYLVDALPATAATGARAYVTDASANTFGANPSGGGVLFAPVVFTGTDWIIG